KYTLFSGGFPDGYGQIAPGASVRFSFTTETEETADDQSALILDFRFPGCCFASLTWRSVPLSGADFLREQRSGTPSHAFCRSSKGRFQLELSHEHMAARMPAFPRPDRCSRSIFNPLCASS